MATTTPQTTYFGDVNVYGNTTMSGTLAVLGTPALFISNLGVATDGTSFIGTQTTPFQYTWTTAANTTSVNFLTNIPGPIGVATTASGATVTVQGNVIVSNSVSTTNVNAITSINTGSVMNVNFLTGPGGVGVGTNIVGSASLAVLGTMNAVTSFQAANLILSGTLNVGTANIFSIATSNIGIGTTPVTGGATLAVQGFATVSNSLATTNVYASVSANVGTINTGALVNSTGFLGFGTAAASGTTAYVLGDLGTSNAVSAPAITSNGLFVSGPLNVASVVVQSNVGVGIAPVTGGPTLSVGGNVFLSNTFTTPQVFAGFMNVANRSNIVTGLATSNVLIGSNANQSKGFNLAVDGNVVVSNALQTTGVSANSLINVGASANLLAFMNAFAIGTTTLFSGASMTVNGNVYASNAMTISKAITTTSNASQTINVITLTVTSNVGVGTGAQTGTPLTVQGNAFASNAVTTTNVFATISANATTLNTTSIFTTSSGFLGISTAAQTGTALNVTGNIFTTNSFTGGQISVLNSNSLSANSLNLGVTANVGVGTAPVAGGAILAVQGNAFISNAVTTTNVYATTSANVLTLNTGPIFTTAAGFLGVGTSTPSGTALYVQGNVYASNALAAPNVQALTMNVTALANVQNFKLATGQFVGIGGTTPTGNALEVSGNAFFSNAIRSTNVFSTLANSGTLNTLSIFTQNSFLGVGTATASGTTLFVPGNVYASTATNTPAMFTPAANVSASGNALTVTSGTGIVVPTRFVAVAQSTTAAAYSNDGITWVASTMPSSVNWQSVTVNPTTGRFVAVAQGTTAAAYSNDGITWVASTMPSVANWRSVTVYYSVGSPSLSLLGNLFASNAVTTTNITATTANVTSVSNVTTLTQIPAIGLGVSAGGAKLNVRGNIVASNSITTTNVFAIRVNTATANVTSIFGTTGFMGVGTTSASGTALYVQGNLYASNELTIGGDIATTSMNVASTLNTGSFTTAIIVADELGWSNTNIFISNSITTTNVFTTNVNAASYVGNTGSIGINTAGSGYALQINGNLALSNTLSSLPDVSAPTSIYYVDDITKRSPHLLPTPSNAALIQNWISTTCNAASQPTEAWWSTSPTPVFGNVAPGAPVSGSYRGSVLLPDGRVLFVPYNAPTIGIFNPTTNEYSEIIPTGATLPSGGTKYSGAVLLPNGNVLFGPQTGNIGIFNPVSNELSNIPVAGLTTSFQVFIVNEPTGNVMISHNGGIASYDPRTGSIYLTTSGVQGSASTLTPTGNIIQIYTSGFRNYNPYNGVVTDTGFGIGSGVAYRSSSLTLSLNGNVVSVPNSFNAGFGNVFVINPNSSPVKLTNIFRMTTGSLFGGSILLPTGNIVCVPFNSSNVLMIDPIALTTSNAAAVGGSGSSLFSGGTLLPDGRVVFAPYNSMNVGVLSTFTPAPVEFCLSPYFNKL
ncbi:hypothetical protein [Yellowstone lake phycodnavirus 3]|uniref:hypothetical protein n=1 Tax=Yellowstone lake phycodnavirus 3 TaxID=1586715 RepID=UPI0006EB5351|nr:hypothetical protein AR677_gp167 [Yellowstone lake phycodnavirus 3]BAT22666.1 hypothetical protein [Yellowstone lake phycodnavirus 3]